MVRLRPTASRFAGLLALGLWLAPAHAKVFSTSYLMIDIPETWECQQISANWACIPKAPNDLHLATLVLTAKEAGPADTLAQLKRTLTQPRTITGSGKLPVISKLLKAEDLVIDQAGWFEATHQNGEIEGFTTHYLVGVYHGLSVLLSFSYDQSRGAQFEPILTRIKSTLKGRVPPKAAAAAAQAGPAPQPQVPVGVKPDAAKPSIHPEGGAKPSALPPTKWLIFGGVALLIILYLLLGRK